MLSEPDNGDGFAITGGSTPTGDVTGFSVAIVGDQNGDGIDDFMVGAPQAAPEGLYQRGKAYLVYGGPGSQPLDLSAISGDSALSFQLLGEYGDAGGSGSPSFDVFDIVQSWHTWVGPSGDGFGFGVARSRHTQHRDESYGQLAGGRSEVTTCDPASTQTGDIVGTLPAIDPDGVR